jgi:prepilin-type N-terminal cleavage/methylation domain-containing protein
MRKLKTKIPGFTLLEVVMAMLLISVVMAMAYAVFFMVNSYEIKMNESNESQNEYLLAAAVFRKDIQKAEYLQAAEDSSLVCVNNLENIIYRIDEPFFLRIKDDVVDTLLKDNAMYFTFLNEENRDHPELIKSAIVTLTDSLGNKSYLSGSKIYSSATLFKSYSDAGN